MQVATIFSVGMASALPYPMPMAYPVPVAYPVADVADIDPYALPKVAVLDEAEERGYHHHDYKLGRVKMQVRSLT